MNGPFIFILLGVGLIVGAFTFGVWADNRSCDQKTIGFADHQWGVFSGCMVLHRGKWLPLENIRGFDDKG